MARERALVASDADEVRYAERAHHPRHPASVDEVRAAVDALEPRRVVLPEPAPVPPEPEPPATGLLPEDVLAALRAVVPGDLVSARPRYVTADGEVVEATSAGPGGSAATALYVVKDGVARALDSIASQVDALPDPTPPPTSAMPVTAPVTTPPPAEETPMQETAPAPAAAAPPEPAKKGGFASRFKLGKDKAKPQDAEAPAAAAEPAPESSASAEKKRFSLRRK